MGVYKEGKNWKVQVYYKDWQGNQKRKQKRGFRTKGEAREWERDFLQQQSQGVDIEFGNFLEIYYKDMDVRLREHREEKTLTKEIVRLLIIGERKKKTTVTLKQDEIKKYFPPEYDEQKIRTVICQLLEEWSNQNH